MTSRRPKQKDALYVSWRLLEAGDGAAGRLHRRLNAGQTRHLYRLRSWVIVGGVVQALLAPAASLDRIAEALWAASTEPVSSRWVGGLACAAIARKIETTPVSLGLASRPEQWPWSSAASH